MELKAVNCKALNYANPLYSITDAKIAIEVTNYKKTELLNSDYIN